MPGVSRLPSIGTNTTESSCSSASSSANTTWPTTVQVARVGPLFHDQPAVRALDLRGGRVAISQDLELALLGEHLLLEREDALAGVVVQFHFSSRDLAPLGIQRGQAVPDARQFLEGALVLVAGDQACLQGLGLGVAPVFEVLDLLSEGVGRVLDLAQPLVQAGQAEGLSAADELAALPAVLREVRNQRFGLLDRAFALRLAHARHHLPHVHAVSRLDQHLADAAGAFGRDLEQADVQDRCFMAMRWRVPESPQ